MHQMSFRKQFLIGLLPLLATGCFPETETWLSDAATAKPDQRLIGTFIGGDSNRERHLVVTEAAGSGSGAAFRLVWVGVKSKDEKKPVVWAAYRAWPARLADGLTLLNLERIGRGRHATDVPDRFFARYDVGADGSVTIRMPRIPSWSRAVSSGALAGHVVKKKYIDRVTLKASRDSLIRYIKANAKVLFDETGTEWRKIQ